VAVAVSERNAPELAACFADVQIVGTEVMAPL
jgi:hypothetical protein